MRQNCPDTACAGFKAVKSLEGVEPDELVAGAVQAIDFQP